MPSRAIEHFFPEVRVSGFTRIDGTIAFLAQINALLKPDMVVLDFGAGRGRAFQDLDLPFHASLALFKGRVGKVIGVDVDPVVTSNPSLDEAHVLDPASGRLPLPDASVDLILADNVFEHIDEPRAIADELDRVLRPGGWICARTPNYWGYISVAARLIPEKLHERVLNRVQPHRQMHDVFPAHYRMNTRAALRSAFSPERFEHCVYGVTAEPAYAGNSKPLWLMMLLIHRFLPEGLKATWLVFLRKKSA